MLKIKPYDLSENFRFIPNREKYNLTFWLGNSVEFSSKREAFRFISHLSLFFNEILATCEVINHTSNSYNIFIKSVSPSLRDKLVKYNNDNAEINIIIRELKYNKLNKIELYQYVRKYNDLIVSIHNNCKIINDHVNKKLSHLLVMLRNLQMSFLYVLQNSKILYKENKLSLFRF